MLPLSIAIGALLSAQKGWKYALIASGLVAAAQALDVAYGPQVGRWLADATKVIFQ